MMKLLLHCCCAPCSIESVKQFQYEYDVTLFWYNPNIHPFTEYKARLNCLKEYASHENIKLFVIDFYGLRYFINNINGDFNGRCNFCYFSRLLSTAKYAKLKGFDAFSTTLLYSPYQNHEKIRSIAQDFSLKFNVFFAYKDIRPFFRIGQDKARKLNLYMQKYCGCIFSEQERYIKKAW